MERFKEAVIKFADSNATLFASSNDHNSPQSVIEQRFSDFFKDFQTPNHPPYAAMIHRAIWELNEKWGSSEESISEYIKKEYKDLPWAHSTLLKHHLGKLCDCQEICLTDKQRYIIAGATPDPLSSSITDKQQLKRKRSSKWGKRSSKHHKKYKSKVENQPNTEETNKLAIEIFQEQNQVHQPLNEMAGKHEIVAVSPLHEPQDLIIGGERYVQGNSLLDILMPNGINDSGVHADTAGQNQSDHGESVSGENVYKNTKFYLLGDKIQSLEVNYNFNQTEIPGRKKGKQSSRSGRRSGKRCNKHEINEETRIQVWNEVTLEQEDKFNKESHGKQNLPLEESLICIQTRPEESVGAGEQNQPERKPKDVAEEVVDGEMAQAAETDTTAFSFQLLHPNEPPNSNSKSTENKRQGGRVWTRSQSKKMFNEGASESSAQIEFSGSETSSKDKFEHLSEETRQAPDFHVMSKTDFPNLLPSSEENDQELQPDILGSGKTTVHLLELEPQTERQRRQTRRWRQEISEPKTAITSDELGSLDHDPLVECKQTPVEVSTEMNGQRAKLRSWQKKNTCHSKVTESLDTPLVQQLHMEPQRNSRSPSPEVPLKELFKPLLKKLRPRHSETKSSNSSGMPEVLLSENKEEQGPHSTLQGQHPNEEEDQAKCEGRGRHSDPKKVEKDEALGNPMSAHICQEGQQSDDVEGQLKYKGQGRRSEPNEVDRNESNCADIPQQDQQSNEEDQLKLKGQRRRHKPKRFEKDEEEEYQERKKPKSRGRRTKPKEVEKDEVLCNTKSEDVPQHGWHSDEEDQPELKGRIRHPKPKRVEKGGKKRKSQGHRTPQSVFLPSRKRPKTHGWGRSQKKNR